MTELGMTEGFDIGLEMSGNPTALNDMMKAMNHGGHVAMLGIPLRKRQLIGIRLFLRAW